jgi:two-component system, OmpR family, response regulator
MKARILLVEDDQRIAAFLRRGLEAEGYAVALAGTGHQALMQARTDRFDLIVLDRMLPGIEGLGVCQILREEGNQTLILMLTAKDSLQDKIDGLNGGADDYLTKPFAFEEAIARIEALLRRPAPANEVVKLSCNDLSLDLTTKIAMRGDREIILTAKEFALLRELMVNGGAVVSRETLLKNVWGLDFDPNTNVVDVCISYLRRKIDTGHDEQLIKTVRGFGFTLPRTVITRNSSD